MWKLILNKAGIFLVIGILCFALYDANRKASAYHQRANTLETTINDLNQEIEYTKIRLNDSIFLYQAEVKSLNMTHDNLKAKYDRLLAASKVRPKDVGSVTEVTSVTQSKDTVIAVVDSFGGLIASLEDSFVNIDVEVLPDKNTIIDYEVRDSLTILNVQKKHSWLFGLIKWKEHKSVRVINHNPKAKIVNLQTIDVIE